jgi:hypothetical protein
LEKLNLSLDIANIIIEDILPYHIDYYLGVRTGDEPPLNEERSTIEESEFYDYSHVIC